ncbi:copper(I)-binding protein [Aquabacterium commune]|uniref:Copper(I)-binding protein n=1 Tax=Aquabacterium commune TaxID=70586 RepID=A0A4R6RNV7_9BURK|nr:copper chaperone PCu(A)C [Aquabacterium commune]TDP88429.1 copper(I)-binding protein [Aquabacterium commune]
MSSKATFASAPDDARARATSAPRVRPWLAGLCLASLAVGTVWAQAPRGQSPQAQPQGRAQAQVQVQDAWLRPTVAGQSATGGYMRLTASQDLQLLGFSSPVAAEAQLHEMVMNGDVMQMRESAALSLPAGTAVALQPGAGQRHLMLMGLKRQLKAGEKVQVVLKLKAADGTAFSQTVVVPVKAKGPAAEAVPSEGGHPHGHDGSHDHKHQHAH